MSFKAEKKVEGGKLVQVELEAGKTIEKASITGDFFLEPPQALEELENKIKGRKVDESAEKFVEAFENVDAELIGFSRKDLAETVKEAVKDE